MTGFLGHGAFGAGGFKGINVPASSSVFLFNEAPGATSAVDSKGVVSITPAGAFTFNGDSLTIDGRTAANRYVYSSNAYYNADSFSIVLFCKFITLGAIVEHLSLSDGTNLTGYSWLLRTANTGLDLIIRSAGGTTQINAAGTVNIDKMTMIVITYTRTGGAADNIARIRWTQDSITWYNASNTSAVLMQQNSGFSIRSNRTSSLGAVNAKNYRQIIFNNKVLTDFEMQSIWDAAAESGAY